MSYHSGFVALIGKPNVGKSTLLNSILKKKVAIATPKPQTTRENIRGILTMQDSQIVFVDTPGIHKAKAKLNELMVKDAYNAISDVDIVCMLIDASKGIEKADKIIMESIKDIHKPKFLVVNKIDSIHKADLLQLLNSLDTDNFDEIIPVSALKRDNLDDLIATITKYLPEDLQYYPSDMISDYPETFMLGEIIREKIMLNTTEEIPHVVAVTIDNVELNNKVYHIDATIIVEKESQKGIIIGKQGQMIKKIGTFAREEIQERLNSLVYLQLFVKVEEDWRNKRSQLQDLGYWQKENNE